MKSNVFKNNFIIQTTDNKIGFLDIYNSMYMRTITKKRK